MRGFQGPREGKTIENGKGLYFGNKILDKGGQMVSCDKVRILPGEKRVEKMKKRFLTNISAGLAISGIVLTMCETRDVKSQLILATIGIMMACAGGYFLCVINRQPDSKK